MIEEMVGEGANALAPAPEAEEASLGPQTFEEMGLHPEVLSALVQMGFARPMQVQSATYAKVMAGRDILVQSRTGSGKTAAFGIPFAQGLVDGAAPYVQALCLCPTRELALQVALECTKIGEHRGLQVVPVYGGAPMGKQVDGLKAGAQIVAGTPGRVLDHLRRGTLKLDRLKVLVLDEADEMLSMGFYEEISEILKRCPPPEARQTMLFSATIPEEIERISRKHMRDPEKIALSADFVGVHEIAHAYYMVSGMGRVRDLERILAVETPESAIVFCNTREETSFVAEQLRRDGFDAEAISSDLTQKDRERVMTRMKAGNLHYLVATDIAARGIDISDLSHVINFTFPESAEVYVHRTGRTGRAGKHGVAISLISPRELGNFYYLKLTYKIRPEERTLPSDEEIQSRRAGERVAELERAVGVEAGEEWRALARRVWSSPNGEGVVARLIERFLAAPPDGAAAAPVLVPALIPVPSPAAAVDAAAVDVAASEAPRREERPRADRPERRDRGERGERGRRGGRGRGRVRDGRSASAPRESHGRDREERPAQPRESHGRDREERPAQPRESQGREREERPARRALPGAPTIEPSDGREFWEAWVDDRIAGSDPAASGGDAPAIADAAPPVDAARPEPRARAERPREELPPGVVRLYYNLGRRDGLSPEQIEQRVRELGATFDRLDVHNSHTYLIVGEAAADETIAKLTGGAHEGRALLCERARR